MVAGNVYSVQNCSLVIDNKPILSHVSLNVSNREFWVVYGKSGTGKSTLLQVLLGFADITSGVVEYCGKALDVGVIAELRKEVAVVFQEPLLLGESIYDVLFEPFAYKFNQSLKPDKRAIKELFKDFDLGHLKLTAPVSTVSGGEKQRLALVRALLLKRKILILDEVSSALDSEHRKQVFEILKQSGLTIIAVSHDQYWIENAPNKLALCRVEKGE